MSNVAHLHALTPPPSPISPVASSSTFAASASISYVDITRFTRELFHLGGGGGGVKELHATRSSEYLQLQWAGGEMP